MYRPEATFGCETGGSAVHSWTGRLLTWRSWIVANFVWRGEWWVATRVGYSRNTGALKNWGFETVFGEEDVEIREQFKLTLDAEYEDDRGYS